MLLIASTTTRAEAQNADTVPLALFPVARNDSALEALSKSVTARLMSELRRLEAVRVAARPALDLPTTQLALGCEDASDDCLRGATGLAHTQALLAPSLEKTAEHTLVSSLLYFDAAGTGSRTLERTHAEPYTEAQVLEGVSAMLHELFGGPQDAAAEGPEAAESAPATTASPAAATAPPSKQLATPAAKVEGESLPVLPLVLTAAGTALLGTGIAFGLLANESKSEYRKSPRPTTPAEAEAVADTLATAQQQAAICTWTLGIGSAALVAGITWWVLDGANGAQPRDHAASTPRTALLPAISARNVALSFQHRW